MAGMLPIRRGALAGEPLPALLHAALRDRFTGVLALAAGGARSTLYLREGHPVAVSAAVNEDTLGEVLAEAGVVDAATLGRVAAGRVPDGALFGRGLVEVGLLTLPRLAEALSAQLRRRVHRLFLLEDASFSLEAGEHPAGADPELAVRIDPRRAIFEGLRDAWAPPRVRAALARVARSQLRLRVDPTALAPFGFGEEEAPIVEELAARPVTLEELDATFGEVDRVGAVVCALLFCDAIEAAADVAASRALLDGKLAALDDPFALLGVGGEATRDEIKAAYFALAKAVHPDRFAAAGQEPLRADAERVFRRVNEAYTTLSDEAKRATFLARRRVTGPHPTVSAAAERQAQVTGTAMVEAEMAFLEGEVQLKRRDFAGAVASFARSVELNPNEGEHHALLAWAKVAAGRSSLASVKPELSRALALSPECARAHYYMGVVLNEEGALDASLASLARAIKLDKRLHEAESLSRVVRRRQEKKGWRGLFGLFKE